MKLGLMQYFKYLAAGENSRNVAEGEAVFDAGHVILCGRTANDTDLINIFALCLQTSALSSDPHEIKGIFKKEYNEVIIISMICSCKAGNSGKCKHISAVLLFCTRTKVDELDLLSKTDIKCMWKAQKTTTRENYRAVAVQNMPCFRDKFIPTPVLQSTDADILHKFLSALPNSAIALHRSGRRSCITDTNVGLENDQILENFVINNSCQSIIMMETSAFNVNINPCCNNKYDELFKECDIKSIIFTKQHSNEWFLQRKYRITGSRIYELYTYAQNDWMNKSLKYFYPKGISNKFTKHGIKYESEARQEFANKINKKVVEIGMVVSNSNNWLGYSSDGVIFEENVPTALIEIKCLFAGATSTIKEAIKTATYINIENNEVKLKRKHKYYGQIQLGMAVLNLTKCYFMIYASFDKSFIILEIPYDYEFSKAMLQKVKHNFFVNMLPYICCRL